METSKPLSRRSTCINHVRSQFKVSERRACRVLGQHRCTQRHIPKGRADEDRLAADMIELARQSGRDGITVHRSRSTENSRF